MSIVEIIPPRFAAALPVRRRHAGATLPAVAPGQLWLVEQAADGAPAAPLRHALASADVVIYDRALADFVADTLPLGAYAEPAAGPETAAARCVGFARDGWSVVRLVPARVAGRERSRRVQDVVDELAAASVAGRLPVAIFAAAGDGTLERIEARFDDLAAIVASHPRETALAVVIAAFGDGGAAAALHAVAANGLAG